MPFLLPVGRRNGKWATDVGRRGRGTTGAAVGAARFLLLYAPIKPFANSRRKALNGDGLVDVEVLYLWRMNALAMETSTRNRKMYLYTFRLFRPNYCCRCLDLTHSGVSVPASDSPSHIWLDIGRHRLHLLVVQPDCCRQLTRLSNCEIPPAKVCIIKLYM
ncbi:hypothetical protein GBAR_LOCUS20 [Geodia barretti]|uniref:Uncharacterized protein n=1 Tax=Geodia barretti TaxID=519541 RepID=A0AA35VR49_GEOBA|nr:hypothetical protein GBAR_LOCUS20 [Geodia barretti]